MGGLPGTLQENNWNHYNLLVDRDTAQHHASNLASLTSNSSSANQNSLTAKSTHENRSSAKCTLKTDLQRIRAIIEGRIEFNKIFKEHLTYIIKKGSQEEKKAAKVYIQYFYPNSMNKNINKYLIPGMQGDIFFYQTIKQ